VSKLAASLTLGLLACGGQTHAAAPPEPIARSALLTLQGSAGAGGVTLWVRPAVSGAAPSVSAVSVSLEGRSASAVRQADGSWFAALRGPLPAGGKLEVFVTHDGIREVLSGTIPAPPPAAPGASGVRALLHGHKQITWWILNIGIVLIAAIAISRRMS
jgi:hypothetical protein